MKKLTNIFSNLRVYAVYFVAALLTALGVDAYGHPAPFTNRATRRQMGAVVAVKSTTITNADATPMVVNKANLAGSRARWHRGVVTAANGDSIGSTYRFARIRSNDLVNRVFVDNATWGAACTADVGLYQTAANGGAVVSAALFASAIDMNAVNRGLDVTRESGTITVANMEKRIWELLGLAADPMIDYDVAATLVAAAAAAGAACFQVEVLGGN